MNTYLLAMHACWSSSKKKVKNNRETGPEAQRKNPRRTGYGKCHFSKLIPPKLQVSFCFLEALYSTLAKLFVWVIFNIPLPVKTARCQNEMGRDKKDKEIC